MNKEAEKEIERLLNIRGTGELRAQAFRFAMEWAYADAAKVCRNVKQGSTLDLVCEGFAQAIEARAKGD